jgi:hypothetical protein
MMRHEHSIHHLDAVNDKIFYLANAAKGKVGGNTDLSHVTVAGGTPATCNLLVIVLSNR